MRRLRALIAGALLLPAIVVGVGQAQVAGEAAAFVRAFVDAINSKSLDRRKALVHPKAQACAILAPGSLFRWMATRQTRDTIPADYKWKLTPIGPTQPLLFADRVDYPLRPTHVLQLDFQTGQRRGKTLLVQVVHEGETWHEVIACPKPKTTADR